MIQHVAVLCFHSVERSLIRHTHTHTTHTHTHRCLKWTVIKPVSLTFLDFVVEWEQIVRLHVSSYKNSSGVLQHLNTHTRGHHIGVMFLYCTNHIFYRPTPTLHLNLPLTGNCGLSTFLKKLSLYDFISFCTHGDLNLGPHRDTSPHESVCIQV